MRTPEIRNASLVLTGLLLLSGGCTPHTTEVTEVGVRFNKLTGSMESLSPGATHFFAPIINDWKTFDTATQSLIMSSRSADGDRKEKDDLRFKTRDGNDIETDVTVRWRIEPQRAGHIWKNVAPDTDTVKERVVRPLARTYVRDVLNRLDSEEYYNPALRFKAAEDATRVLGAQAKPYGVVIEQVILGNFAFKKEYQDLINARKEAEKKAEKLESEILATEQASEATLQQKIAQLTQELTAAQGALEQAKKGADAFYVRRGQEAQATLAEKAAAAEGVRRERAALNGSAGDAYVTLQLIEALQKKEIRQIPKMPAGNVIIDGNQLLQQLGVVQYNEKQRAKDKPE